jgi:hypothetical protein
MPSGKTEMTVGEPETPSGMTAMTVGEPETASGKRPVGRSHQTTSRKRVGAVGEGVRSQDYLHGFQSASTSLDIGPLPMTYHQLLSRQIDKRA